MDLVGLYREYEGIINLGLALLLPVLGYLFGKWSSERTRKWELRDRQLKEAYASLNTYRNVVDILVNWEKAVTGILGSFEQYRDMSEEQIEKNMKRLGDHAIAVNQIPKLLWDVLEMTTSIVVLRDRQLSKLEQELSSHVLSELDNVTNFLGKLKQVDSGQSSDVENFLEEAKVESDRVRKFSVKAHGLITIIKLELDRLAQRVS